MLAQGCRRFREYKGSCSAVCRRFNGSVCSFWLCWTVCFWARCSDFFSAKLLIQSVGLTFGKCLALTDLKLLIPLPNDSGGSLKMGTSQITFSDPCLGMPRLGASVCWVWMIRAVGPHSSSTEIMFWAFSLASARRISLIWVYLQGLNTSMCLNGDVQHWLCSYLILVPFRVGPLHKNLSNTSCSAALW